MRLTDYLTGDKQVSSDVGKTQPNIVKTDVINRQIRSMVPGQTLHGDVIARNGSEVQIRLSDDLVLQAKLDQNLNLEIGKNMTFEVKNNGKALVLSPLFTNVATDANVLKALDMASLPLNNTTVNMTKQLMGAGLAIDRNTLQQVFREVNMFPQAPTSDIVSLHKMQMPVNEGNMAQMESYRNLTHQLVTGMNDVLNAVPDLFAGMVNSGDTEGAAKLYQQLVMLVQEGMAEGESISGNPMSTPTTGIVLSQEGMLPSNLNVITGQMGVALGENPAMGTAILPGMNVPVGEATQNQVYAAVIQALEQVGEMPAEQQLATGQLQGAGIDSLERLLPAGQTQEGQQHGEHLVDVLKEGFLSEEGVQNQQKFFYSENSINTVETHANNLLNALSGLRGSNVFSLSSEQFLSELQQMIQRTLSGGKDVKELLKPLAEALKEQWTITPEQVADAEQVEGLYRRFDKQLKGLAQTMENTGRTDNAAYRAVANMTQNLDFLQQINQMYTYVQLPLRLQNGEAHGDLYVYTNKKHLAAKEGQISALLHLDMEHLGPVDVYVAMQSEKVNTKFYLQDDEMLDFISGHMDILTQRLQKRGYHCDFEMMVRNQEEESKSGIQRLLEQEKQVPLAEYAFDVRT